VLQGKGGVGKTFVASLLAQYLQDTNRLSGTYDTDPVNRSLSSITALQTKPVELLAKNALNVKAVDGLVQDIMTATGHIVVDNGASSFLPFSRYLVSSDIVGMLSKHNVSTTIHAPVTGGVNGMDTVKGLAALIDHFTPAARLVVWVNEFYGPVRFDGVDFEKTAIYRDHKDVISGLVYLRALDPEMFAPNLADMLERRLTFREALAGDGFMIMEKHRLGQIRDDIWDQLRGII
jgi:hypothetical protein